jgi:hypothetical protein
MLLSQNKELSNMRRGVSVIYKSIYMEAFQAIILLVHFAVRKYNSIEILRFLRGGYYDSGGEFHI